MNVAEDQSLPSKCNCGKPIPIRFGDCVVCNRDNCLGGWLWTQATKHAAGAARIRIIRERGDDAWEDFIQYWRGYAWRKAAEGAGSVGHLDVVTATKTWLSKLKRCEIPMELGEYGEEDDVVDSDTRSTNDMTLREVLDRDVRCLADGEGYQVTDTLALELLRLGCAEQEDKPLMLGLAKQLEVQDVALLRKEKPRETLVAMEGLRVYLREVA